MALLPTVDRYTGTALEGWHRGYRAALRQEVFRLKEVNPGIKEPELLSAAQGWMSTRRRPRGVPKQLTYKHLSALLAGPPPAVRGSRAPITRATPQRPSVSVTAPKGSRKVAVSASPRGTAIDVSWPAIPLAIRIKVVVYDRSGKRITTRRASGDARSIIFERVPATGQPVTVTLSAFSRSGVQVAHGHAVVAVTAPTVAPVSKLPPKPADPAAIALERAKVRSELAALELRSTPSSAASPKKRSRKNARRR